MRNSRKGRFRVWDRSQDSFSGEDLVYNFDEMDKLIGGPGGFEGTSGNTYSGTPTRWLGPGDIIPPRSNSTYPGTANGGAEIQSGQRTLYSVASGLNFNDVPLGTVIAWWRPASSIAVPDGWTPCDGRTVTDHSFPIDAAITLPDLRNKFIIGADAALPGINAVSGYAHEAGAQPAQNVDNTWSGTQATSTGAPSVGWDSGLETNAKSGSNVIRSLAHSHSAGNYMIRDHFHTMSHTHQLPAHSHAIPDHRHNFSHIHMTPDHAHNFGGAQSIRTNSAPWGEDFFVRVKENTAAGNPFVAKAEHTHPINAPAFGFTGHRESLSNNSGFYPYGATASPWNYPQPPSFYYWTQGYGQANLTSFPTNRRVSGNNIIGHEEMTETGLTSPTVVSTLINDKSKFISDGPSVERTQGISNTTTNLLNESKKLDGLSGQIVLPNRTAADPGLLEVNVRGQYVGMLYLMKTKVSTNVI